MGGKKTVSLSMPISIRLQIHQKCLVVLTQFWVKYGQTQTLG